MCFEERIANITDKYDLNVREQRLAYLEEMDELERQWAFEFDKSMGLHQGLDYQSVRHEYLN